LRCPKKCIEVRFILKIFLALINYHSYYLRVKINFSIEFQFLHTPSTILDILIREREREGERRRRRRRKREKERKKEKRVCFWVLKF